MKKKNLKNLLLHKCSVSNLTLLHRKTGGALPAPNTDTGSYIDPNITSLAVDECTFVDPSGAPECPSWAIHNCHTNAGTTKAKPPSEHEACQAGGTGGAMYNGVV
ncbi:MAG: hypothetical protein AB8B65_14140 [Kordia sp.]|uniref:hypothetical protein n=1 Tax=Kordia sp. TaxID=1965332 RepID=UPI00385A4234